MRVDEIDDARPCIPLRLAPQPGAAGRDATDRRHTRHFRYDQPGTAGGSRAVMHEVPISWHTIDGEVLRHWRDDHAIDELHATQSERKKHRRSRPTHTCAA